MMVIWTCLYHLKTLFLVTCEPVHVFTLQACTSLQGLNPEEGRAGEGGGGPGSPRQGVEQLLSKGELLKASCSKLQCLCIRLRCLGINLQ